jgi:hypothetical protein
MLWIVFDKGVTVVRLNGALFIQRFFVCFFNDLIVV